MSSVVAAAPSVEHFVCLTVAIGASDGGALQDATQCVTPFHLLQVTPASAYRNSKTGKKSILQPAVKSAVAAIDSRGTAAELMQQVMLMGSIWLHVQQQFVWGAVRIPVYCSGTSLGIESSHGTEASVKQCTFSSIRLCKTMRAGQGGVQTTVRYSSALLQSLYAGSQKCIPTNPNAELSITFISRFQEDHANICADMKAWCPPVVYTKL